LDGYVPTSYGKERLYTECKAIEQNEPKKGPNKKLPPKSMVHKKNHGSVKNTVDGQKRQIQSTTVPNTVQIPGTVLKNASRLKIEQKRLVAESP
jgi:hypothetical protein